MDCSLSDWTDWAGCSVSCGPGAARKALLQRVPQALRRGPVALRRRLRMEVVTAVLRRLGLESPFVSRCFKSFSEGDLQDLRYEKKLLG